MAVVAAAPATVNLTAGCVLEHCLRMGWELKRQLDPAYSHGAAVMRLDGNYPDYLKARRTARKRMWRAERLGYRFQHIDRPSYVDDIYRINTSMRERQGRPMSDSYLERPRYSPLDWACARHHVYTYGVVSAPGPLAAYLWLYRAGDLALVSSILGHADHLANDVMYLLFLRMVERQLRHGGTLFYNLWDSGTDGLRFYKARVGLVKGDIAWEVS